MTKINGTEEHGLLQVIIRMIRPPPCSSISLQMVICKRMVLRTTKIKGTEEHGLLHYPDDPASSVLLRSFANGHLQRKRSSR